MNNKLAITRKTNSIPLFVLGVLLIITILINAEAYYFGIKFNGLAASLFAGSIGLVGIILGIFHSANKKRADIPVIVWYAIFTSVIIGNSWF